MCSTELCRLPCSTWRQLVLAPQGKGRTACGCHTSSTNRQPGPSWSPPPLTPRPSSGPPPTPSLCHALGLIRVKVSTGVCVCVCISFCVWACIYRVHFREKCQWAIWLLGSNNNGPSGILNGPLSGAPSDAQFARLWSTGTEIHSLQVCPVHGIDHLNWLVSGVFTF